MAVTCGSDVLAQNGSFSTALHRELQNIRKRCTMTPPPYYHHGDTICFVPTTVSRTATAILNVNDRAISSVLQDTRCKENGHQDSLTYTKIQQVRRPLHRSWHRSRHTGGVWHASFSHVKKYRMG